MNTLHSTASRKTLGRLSSSLTRQSPAAFYARGASLVSRTAAATAGVPLALLVEERCGACRTPIEHGRVVDMRSQGNVAVCPNCGRLLILQAH